MTAGASLGIERGSHFDFCPSKSFSSGSTGTLVVHTVDEFTSIMRPLDCSWSLGKSGFAKYQTQQSSTEMSGNSFRVFVEESDGSLLDAVRSFERDFPRVTGRGGAARMHIVTDKNSAHLSIATRAGKMLFSILDERCTANGLTHIDKEPPFDIQHLGTILLASTHFYAYLNLSDSNSKKDRMLRDHIRIECYALRNCGTVQKPIIVEDGENVVKDGAITISLQAESDTAEVRSKPYGFKVTSSYSQPVFVYMFYFDNIDLSISTLEALCCYL